jgi:hypothetical protein
VEWASIRSIGRGLNNLGNTCFLVWILVEVLTELKSTCWFFYSSFLFPECCPTMLELLPCSCQLLSISRTFAIMYDLTRHCICPECTPVPFKQIDEHHLTGASDIFFSSRSHH